MTLKNEAAKMLLRLPHELKNWIAQRAQDNWTSQNAEVIRALRSQMESEQSASAG
jgi:hypothetical protein